MYTQIYGKLIILKMLILRKILNFLLIGAPKNVPSFVTHTVVQFLLENEMLIQDKN